MIHSKTFIIQSDTKLFRLYSAVLCLIIGNSLLWASPVSMTESFFYLLAILLLTIALYWYFLYCLSKPYPLNLHYENKQWHLQTSGETNTAHSMPVNLLTEYWLSEQLLVLPFQNPDNRAVKVLLLSRGSLPENQLRQLRQLIHMKTQP